MSKKILFSLVSSIILVLLLLITSCTTSASTPTTTSTKPAATVTVTATAAPVSVDKKYNVLNPRGVALPVDIKPLAERPDTLDGKVVYVNQGEADPVIMPALWARVQKDYPKATWKYIEASSFGPSRPEADVTANAKAVIRGIGW